MPYAPRSLSYWDGIDKEHARVVKVIEELDITENMKDLIIHAIARGENNEN